MTVARQAGAAQIGMSVALVRSAHGRADIVW
jgi:hypothetical protein